MTRSHFFTRFLLAFALAFLAGPAALGPPSAWPGIAPAMAEGVRFAFNWRGTYDAAKQYITNDLVGYGGSVYRAKVASLGQTPSASSTYWETFVSKGTDGTPTGYASLALLKAATPANNDRALLQDYGIYRFDSGSSATANDGNVIAPNAGAGRWLLEVDGVTFARDVSVEEYGAIPDDANDDTTAIQAALTALNTAGGGILRFPKGVFRFTRLTIRQNVSMIGAGAGATTLLCTNGSTLDTGSSFGSALKRLDDNAVCYHPRFKGFSLVTATSGIAAAQTSNQPMIGLNLTGVAYAHVEDVSIAGFGAAGIALAQADNGSEGFGFTNTLQDGNYNTFVNVEVSGNGAYNTVAMTADSVSGTTVSGNATVTLAGASAHENALRLRIGDAVSGTGIQAGATIVGINTSTDTFTMSATATANGTVTIGRTQVTAPNIWLRYKANSNKFFGVYQKGSVTNETITGSVTSGSNNITSVSASDIAKIAVGQYVTGTGMPAHAQVATISATSFTISANAESGAGTPVSLQAFRHTTGIAIPYGDDNAFYGGSWESIPRGIRFSTLAANNILSGFRAEGLLDAVIQDHASATNNAIGTIHESTTRTFLDIPSSGTLRVQTGPFNRMRTGVKQTSSLATQIDYHFLDVMGLLGGTDGYLWVKAPGYDTLANPSGNVLKLAFWNAMLTRVSGDSLGEIRFRNSDSSASVIDGDNAIIRAQAYGSNGESGFTFLTGTDNAPTQKVEVLDYFRAGGSALATAADFFRDSTAGETTNTVTVGVGNKTAQHGMIRLQYVNAAAAGSPTARLTFQPRNNAGSSDIEGGKLEFQKTAGANTAQIDLTGSNGANLRLLDTGNINLTTVASTGRVQVDGNLQLATAGNGILIKEGSNATMGTETLVGGAATVSTTKVTANSRIFLTSQVDGGTPGWLRVDTRTAATSFHIQSSSGTDTSTVGWVILEPAP